MFEALRVSSEIQRTAMNPSSVLIVQSRLGGPRALTETWLRAPFVFYVLIWAGACTPTRFGRGHPVYMAHCLPGGFLSFLIGWPPAHRPASLVVLVKAVEHWLMACPVDSISSWFVAGPCWPTRRACLVKAVQYWLLACPVDTIDLCFSLAPVR